MAGQTECAKCGQEAAALTYGGGAKKMYGGGICAGCLKAGALLKGAA